MYVCTYVPMYVCMYVYFIGTSVNIIYKITHNYILYNITQDLTHQAHMGLLLPYLGQKLYCSIYFDNVWL